MGSQLTNSMSARDFFHNAVKTALIKDGWEITDDPFTLRFGGVNMSIDLGAEKLIAAQKQDSENCSGSQKLS